jgi:hypothetical protein
MIEIKPTIHEPNEINDSDFVCFCFEYTKKDIEDDFKKNDRSLIYEKIIFEKKTGGCNCASKNPKGK